MTDLSPSGKHLIGIKCSFFNKVSLMRERTFFSGDPEIRVARKDDMKYHLNLIVITLHSIQIVLHYDVIIIIVTIV